MRPLKPAFVSEAKILIAELALVEPGAICAFHCAHAADISPEHERVLVG